MMMHLTLKVAAFLALILLILFGSCNQTAKYDRKALAEEMENREIKRVSDAEITKAAFQQGAMIADTAQQIIFSALHQEALLKDSLSAVLQLYKTSTKTVKGSLAENYDATIRRVSFKSANQENNPQELEKLVLDSYLYSVENDLPLKENVQKIDEYYFLYTKPIVINNAACLRCHGEINEDISEANYEALKEAYPKNEAFGYKLGDFRGMWSIKLSKKELIRNL